MAEQQKQTKEQDINQLLKVRREKLQTLQEEGKDPFRITKYDVTHHSMEIKEHFEELEGKEVTVAGRVMQKRVMGKASFCNAAAPPWRHCFRPSGGIPRPWRCPWGHPDRCSTACPADTGHRGSRPRRNG